MTILRPRHLRSVRRSAVAYLPTITAPVLAAGTRDAAGSARQGPRPSVSRLRPVSARVAVSTSADGPDLVALQAQLPVDWEVVDVDSLEDAQEADVYVLAGADPETIVDRRRRSGGASLIAYLPSSASAGDVVAMLHAGADGCVRPCEPVLLAAHVRACHRRHPHDRIRSAS
jgi:hypothetical protein